MAGRYPLGRSNKNPGTEFLFSQPEDEQRSLEQARKCGSQFEVLCFSSMRTTATPIVHP